MNINTINQTNFGANFINNVNIKRLDFKTHKYCSLKSSFIQFDPQNKNDFNALKEAVKDWKGDNYASTIVDYANKIITKSLSDKIHRIYMLTTQNKGFENLDKKQILGLVQMQSDTINPDEIRYLQVKPDIKYGNNKRAYKNIGSKIISSLKAIYNKKITLISSYSAANFYEKQGFKITDLALLEYEWNNEGVNKQHKRH